MTRIAVAAALLLTTVVLGSACGSGGGEKADPPRVAIADFAFGPSPLRVKAGATVTFTNRDDFEHTVTAKDRSFDSGHLAHAATFERTFDAPGTYPYFCGIHNSMTGTVIAF